MVNEPRFRRRSVALVSAGLVLALTSCGSSKPTVASPADEPTDAPTYASCEELSEVFDPSVENQLSYLPEEHWLIVSPSSTTYRIDLVDDTACIAANPALAAFVKRFEAAYVVSD